MNLYTAALKIMSTSDSLKNHHRHITQHLGSILVYMEELLEDPIFINGIHGEQEIRFDQAADLISDLMDLFGPQEDEENYVPVRDSELYDVT